MFGLDNLIDMLFETAMEGINRNERVIQLLKRLNLDPDHPPADFTGVYQYALVEYGVGKSRPVLEIFRQPKIQTLFREALEHNTPSILLKNGEDFLADHPLQVDLQANNIDVRREFYAFRFTGARCVRHHENSITSVNALIFNPHLGWNTGTDRMLDAGHFCH